VEEAFINFNLEYIFDLIEKILVILSDRTNRHLLDFEQEYETKEWQIDSDKETGGQDKPSFYEERKKTLLETIQQELLVTLKFV